MLPQIIKTELIDRFDPEYLQLKQAVRTGVAGLIAILLYRHFNWPEGFWIIFAAVFILQTNFGPTLRQQLTHVAISGILAALGAVSVLWFTHSTLSLICFLGLTTFISVYCASLGLDYFISAFFINFFILMSSGLSAELQSTSMRLIMILAGCGIDLVLLLCLWPTRLAHSIQTSLTTSLQALAALSHYTAYYYLETSLPKTALEEHLHKRRSRTIRSIQRVRELLTIAEQTRPQNFATIKATKILYNLEHIYEIILSLGQLRHHLRNREIYPLLENEMTLLLNTLPTVLRQFAQQLRYSQKVTALEAIFSLLTQFNYAYHALRERLEPQQLLAFAVFNHNLRSLHNILVAFLKINNEAG